MNTRQHYMVSLATPINFKEQGFLNLKTAYSAFKKVLKDAEGMGFPATVRLNEVILKDGEITNERIVAEVSPACGEAFYCPHSFYHKPVDGCEDCAYSVMAAGEDATACPECQAYGDTELGVI